MFSYIFQLCLGIYWGAIYFKRNKFRKIDFSLSAIAFGLGLLFYAFIEYLGQDPVYKMGFDVLFNPLFFLLGYSLFTSDYFESYWQILNLDIFAFLGIYSYQIFLTHQPLFFVLLPLLIQYLSIAPYLKLAIVISLTAIILFVYIYFACRLDVSIARLWLFKKKN